MADRPDKLDRIEEWARDTLSIATIPHAADVLLLVRVARAARDYRANSIPVGRYIGSADALDAALAELEADK